MGFFRVILFGTLCASWIWYLLLFSGSEIFQPLFIWMSFLPFSLSIPLLGLSIVHILVHLMRFHKCYMLSLLFFIIFYFCFSNWKNFTALSLSFLILCFMWSNLLLNTSIEYFSSIIIFFSSVISIWCFLIPYWNTYFVISFFWPWWAFIWLLFWPLFGWIISISLRSVSRDLISYFNWDIFPCFSSSFFFFDSHYWFLHII